MVCENVKYRSIIFYIFLNRVLKKSGKINWTLITQTSIKLEKLLKLNVLKRIIKFRKLILW